MWLMRLLVHKNFHRIFADMGSGSFCFSGCFGKAGEEKVYLSMVDLKRRVLDSEVE
jgi:hypothetical protein